MVLLAILACSQEFFWRLKAIRDLDALLVAAYRCIESCNKVADEAGSSLCYLTLERAKVCRAAQQDWFKERGIEVTVLDSDEFLLQDATGERLRYRATLRADGSVQLIPEVEPVLQQG
jgi:hypothetical protein